MKKHKTGIQAIWITPLRALAVEIQKAIQIMTNDLNPDLKIALRTGDTSQKERGNQKRKPSFGLVTTPESLHLLLSTKDHQKTLQESENNCNRRMARASGNKKGVQIELAIAYLNYFLPNLKVWGISATIGNKDLASKILLGSSKSFVTVNAEIQKKIEVESILPKNMERFPWRGHLGIHLLSHVLEIVKKIKLH